MPTTTLPKLTLAGVGLTLPGAVTVAVRGMVSEPLEALLVITALPFAVPAVCGVRVTVNVAVFPAAIVAGTVIPLRL